MSLTLTVEQLVIAGLTVLGGGTGIVYLLGRGFWAKSVQPMVVAEIATYLQRPEVVAGTRTASRAEVVLLQNEPGSIDTRKKETIAVIDDQLRRDDGLIHREMATRFQRQNDHFDRKMDEILDAVRDRNDSQDQILNRLARVEGMVAVLLKNGYGTSVSSDAIPAVRPVRPDPRKDEG